MHLNFLRIGLLAGGLVWIFVSLLPPAAALDPGRVQGSLEIDGQAVGLTQAYAHLHDNAEKLLDRPKELRILLADREMSQEALAGLPPLLVESMAREGRVQGLLLKLDPGDQRHLELTLLSPGPKLQTWIINLSAKGSTVAGRRSPGREALEARPNPEAVLPILKLNIHPQRLGGAFTWHTGLRLETANRSGFSGSLDFSAPLFRELPVTTILVGRAAESWARRASIPLVESRTPPRRVVVRGRIATAIFGNNHWETYIRDDSVWRNDRRGPDRERP